MADTPITPGVTSLTVAAAAVAMGFGMVPPAGALPLAAIYPSQLQQRANSAFVPTVAALSVAGVAPVLQQRTNTNIAPTVVAVTLAGVASSLTRLVGTLAVPESAQGGVVTWPAILNGNTGMLSPLFWYRQASFQVFGTFGAGGSVKLQGSNDGVNWADLSPTALTGAGFFASLGATERPKYFRPVCTAGDGSTSLTMVGWFS